VTSSYPGLVFRGVRDFRRAAVSEAIRTLGRRDLGIFGQEFRFPPTWKRTYPAGMELTDAVAVATGPKVRHDAAQGVSGRDRGRRADH
jgi:hypothetical protein